MLDASVLIDHFRAKDKEKTLYTKIVREYDIRSISVIAKLEVLYGTRSELVEYWNTVFATMMVIPFTNDMVGKSHEIILDLKQKSLLLDMEDIHGRHYDRRHSTCPQYPIGNAESQTL